MSLTSLFGLLALLIAGVAAERATPAFSRSSAAHSRPVTLAPVPDDFALAEIRVPAAIRRRVSVDRLHLAVEGPLGADYLAFAAPRGVSGGEEWALILLVNRASPLLDPVAVKLSMSAPGSAAQTVTRLTVLRVTDPLSVPTASRRPALCDLTHDGVPLGAKALRRLQSVGAPIGHFSAAGAVAEAYDASCDLPYSQTFKQELGSLTGASPAPSPSPSPAPVPAPSPPAPGPPGCSPCRPRPGYACPLARESICVAVSSTRPRSGQAGR
jgi:hypothetical protein